MIRGSVQVGLTKCLLAADSRIFAGSQNSTVALIVNFICKSGAAEHVVMALF